MKICLTCNLEIPRRGGKYYCSLKCRSTGTIKKNRKNISLQKKCVVCSKDYDVDYYNRKYSKLCSKVCVGEFNRRRITGLKDNSKYIIANCLCCDNEFERRKLDIKRKNGKIFCSKSCRSKYSFEHGVRDVLRSHNFKINGLTVRSRWEAAFIKDYLERNNLEWEYEPERFDVDGRGYRPDFYIKTLDMWVEVKGCLYFDRFNKCQRFQELYPELNYVVADANVLQNRFGLNLSEQRLSELIA